MAKKKATTQKKTNKSKAAPSRVVKDISHKFRLTRKAKETAGPLPKLVTFTKFVFAQLWSERSLFLRFFLVSVAITLLLFGATQQEQYVATTNALKEYGATLTDQGFGPTVQFGVLLATATTGGLNSTLSETQKVYFSLFYLMLWLVTVWLLRQRLAGVAVVVRDGFYNAGAPLVTTILLAFVGVAQLIPMAIGIIVYSAAMNSGVLQGPFEVGSFALGAILLSVLSLYWVSSTLFAIVIATNPGTYPVLALRAANKVVAGRRVGLAIRLLWLMLLVTLMWIIVLVPAVLLDSWISQPSVPIVVLTVQVLTSFSVIFTSSYIYLLYRKMIDESAS